MLQLKSFLCHLSQVYFVASSLSSKYTRIVSILGVFQSQEIAVNTSGRLPLIPQVLSTFMVISDEMQKYFAIHVCTGYYRVGYSPPLYYVYDHMFFVRSL